MYVFNLIQFNSIQYGLTQCNSIQSIIYFRENVHIQVQIYS